jgi:hypothetical protein
MATRDVVFQISAKVDGPSPKQVFDDSAAASKAAAASAKAYAKDLQAALKEAATTAKSAQKEVAAAQQAAAKASQEYAKATQGSNKEVGEGIKKMAEGFIALGRAVGFAGVATSKDMEAAVRVFARFQAGAEVFKGVLDVVEGANKVWQTYTTIKKAAAAADAAQAAASMVSARASAMAGAASAAGGVAGAVGGAGGAAGAIGGIMAALGPIGLALAAFGIAVAAITFFMDDSAEQAKRAAEKWKKVVENSDNEIEALKGISNERAMMRDSASLSGEAAAYRLPRDQREAALSANRYSTAQARLNDASAWNSAAVQYANTAEGDEQRLSSQGNLANSSKEMVEAQKAMVEAEKARFKELEAFKQSELQVANEKLNK